MDYIVPHCEKMKIKDKLEFYGINVDIASGKITYFNNDYPPVNCKSIYLLRHGETLAASKNVFMNDESANAALTKNGIEKLKETSVEIQKLNFDVAFYSPIGRVAATKDIIKKYVPELQCKELGFMNGIDNTQWVGLTYDGVMRKYKESFEEREIKHNIFATAPGGNCWGDVICNCIDTIEFINKSLANNVLLISQGSVLRGMQIILKINANPWDNYSAEKMFRLENVNQEGSTYGKLVRLV